jgi:hypothetical protein
MKKAKKAKLRRRAFNCQACWRSQNRCSFEFLLDRVAIVTVITPVGRNCKTNLAAITPMRRNSINVEGNWRAQSLNGMVRRFEMSLDAEQAWR